MMREFIEKSFERNLTPDEIDDLFVKNYNKNTPKLDLDEQLAFDKDLSKTKALKVSIIKVSELGDENKMINSFYSKFVEHASVYTNTRVEHIRNETRRDRVDYDLEKKARDAEVKRHSRHINIFIDFKNLLNFASCIESAECDLMSYEISKNLHSYGLTDKVSFPNPNTLQDNYAQKKELFYDLMTKLAALESTIIQYPDAYPNQTDEDLKDFMEITDNMKNELKDLGLTDADISSYKHSLMCLATRVAYLEKHPQI